MGGNALKFFWEKAKLGTFFTKSEKLSDMGKSETGGKMHHCLRGDGRPWLQCLWFEAYSIRVFFINLLRSICLFHLVVL